MTDVDRVCLELPKRERLPIAFTVAGVPCGVAAGEIVSLVGIALILVALSGMRYRAPWLQTALWILSILWLLSFPVGTVLGIVVIVYLIHHKEELTVQEHPERT